MDAETERTDEIRHTFASGVIIIDDRNYDFAEHSGLQHRARCCAAPRPPSIPREEDFGIPS